MLRKYPNWRRRTACSLAYLLAFSTLSMPVFAADTPDQTPPPPPAAESDTSNPAPDQVKPANPVPPVVTEAPKPLVDAEPFLADSLGVLIFPIDVDETVQGAPKDISVDLAARISMALNRSNSMDSAVFYRNSPIIQRAISENRLKPIMNGSSLPDRLPDSALPIIAREYNAKTVVTGSITGYVFDKTNNSVEIDLTLNQKDLQNKGKNRLIVVSGQSKPSPVVSSEIALAAEASDDLAMKTAGAIAGVTTESIKNPSSPSAKNADHVGKKKRSSFGIIAGALVLIAIIAAASNHHGGSSSTSSGSSSDGGTPPSTPNL